MSNHVGVTYTIRVREFCAISGDVKSGIASCSDKEISKNNSYLFLYWDFRFSHRHIREFE